MLTCQWKNIGVECAGCGMQRSFIALLKGDFVEAFQMYPAIYTLIFMFAYLMLHLKFQFMNGHKVLLKLFILNLIIIVTSYVIKIF